MINAQIKHITNLIRIQWKVVSLGLLIIISFVITLSLPKHNSDQLVNNGNIQINQKNKSDKDSSSPAKESKNLLEYLFSKNVATENNKIPEPTQSKIPQNIVNTNTSNSTVTKLNSDGTEQTQSIDGSTIIKTTHGSINPNVSFDKKETDSDADIIAIVFQNPDGSKTNYIPPGTPPDEIRWAKYTNIKDKYSINYPYNWQLVHSVDGNGHEGIALYPPGVNKKDKQSPFVGFGISRNLLLPAAGDTSSALITPLRIDGVNGNLYTNGSLGTSYIAASFNYNENYFGLGASKSDVTFSYVYYFMIQSLAFNIK